jgi:hypothetical protein
MDDTTKRLMLSGGEPIEYPGCWKIDGRIEGESDSWSVVRKPDGTWWYVAVNHIFPPEGGLLRIELGDKIEDLKIIAECDEFYAGMQKQMEEMMKEGDRVRVIKTGTTGVVKVFGSVPGVPKLVNVAYDGGGGCNHRPEELEKVKDTFTL